MGNLRSNKTDQEWEDLLSFDLASCKSNLPVANTRMHAAISKCGKYRYSLTRIWDESKPKVMFIMLNPSVADSDKDDPTIRRCIGFAKDWGLGGIYVANLFSLIATNPKDLLTAPFIVGVDNERWFKRMSALSNFVVCAWGNGKIVGKLQKRLDHTWKPLSWVDKPLHYLELSNDGTPKHPLYLPKTTQPKAYMISKYNLLKEFI